MVATAKQYQPRATTRQLLENVSDILASYDGAVTLRQLFYQLVAHHDYPNTENSYKSLSGHLTKARVHGVIDGERIIDRTREVESPYGFSDLTHFLDTVKRAYRRRRWQGQDEYVEVWVEKDALAGVVQAVTSEYGVPLQVCRGYPSFSALREAAGRYCAEDVGGDSAQCHLLYFGDFDPSGQDIPRAIQDNLDLWFGCEVDLELVALTRAQIQEHHLPSAPTKRTDTRRTSFVAKHGDQTVELDALPPDVLQDMVREAIERYWDKMLAALIDGEGPNRTWGDDD